MGCGGTTSTCPHSCEKKLTEFLSSVCFFCSSELQAAAFPLRPFVCAQLCFCRPLSKILVRVAATSWSVPSHSKFPRLQHYSRGLESKVVPLSQCANRTLRKYETNDANRQ